MIARTLKLALCASLAFLGAIYADLPAKAAQGSACMPTTGTVSGLQFSLDVNAALASLLSSNSGAAAPTNDCTAAPVLGQVWLDTSSAPRALKYYDGGGSWLTVGRLDGTNHLFLPTLGGGVVTITAGATSDLCANKQTFQTVNGAASISSFGSTGCQLGEMRVVQFGAGSTIVASTAIAVPFSGNNIVTVGADRALMVYTGGGNWMISLYQRADGTALYGGVVIGSMIQFLGGACPTGYFEANGQAVSRSTLSTLFATIGTTFGAGNGSTTFNLPDMRGQFARGYDNGRGVDPGRVFGSAQSDAFASHNHTVTDPGHLHGLKGTVDAQAGATLATPIGGGTTAVTNTDTAFTGITLGNTGGTETRPKNIAILFCVRG